MSTNDDPVEQFLTRCEPEVSSSAERHRRLRSKLVSFFRWKRCEDPEALADETIARLVTNIRAGAVIEKPGSYVRGIALNVYREHIREIIRLRPHQADWELALQKPEGSPEERAVSECMNLCLDKLSDDKRLVLERYYSEDESREQLAAWFGLTLPALRIKIFRIKAELKDCFQKCIGRSSPG
ncbi:MAG TPA: sigma-70 family RNA polymerase sigma factor [Blastocatellia bacterium]|nr:sigma-70 family RNA polymerase sigma factor [Blastocatellia bacterium]